MSLLAFREVSKRFPDGTREIAVLDRVSFEVEVGERVGLLASRRAGKTTLLKIASGLMLPDGGEVFWDGADLVQMSRDACARARRRRGIALVRGDWRAQRAVSVLRHIAQPLYSGGLNMLEAERRALLALEVVDATNLGGRQTNELGLHERLRVEFARAIVREPRLLLVDEPAVLPQRDDARAIYELLLSLSDRVGCALLIASEEVSALHGCNPVMSLSGGRLRSSAERRKVIDFPSAVGTD